MAPIRCFGQANVVRESEHDESFAVIRSLRCGSQEIIHVIARPLGLRLDNNFVPIAVGSCGDVGSKPFIVLKVQRGGVHVTQLCLPSIEVGVGWLSDAAIVDMPTDSDSRLAGIVEIPPDKHFLVDVLSRIVGVFLSDDRVFDGGAAIICKCRAIILLIDCSA